MSAAAQVHGMLMLRGERFYRLLLQHTSLPWHAYSLPGTGEVHCMQAVHIVWNGVLPYVVNVIYLLKCSAQHAAASLCAACKRAMFNTAVVSQRCNWWLHAATFPHCSLHTYTMQNICA